MTNKKNSETTIPFVTEDGEEVLFRVVEETTFGGSRYLLVLADIDEDEQDALILKDTSADTDTEAVYEIVEDEKEMNALAGIFEELLDDTELVTGESGTEV